MKITIRDDDGDWIIEGWDEIQHGPMPHDLPEALNEAFAQVHEQGRKAGREDVLEVLNDKTFFMMRDHIVPIINEQLADKDHGSE